MRTAVLLFDEVVVVAHEPRPDGTRQMPEVGIVIFDSQQAPGTGEALYVDARAEQVPDDEINRALEVFNRASVAQGLPAWPRENVVEPARHRLYRAIAVEHSVLDAGDHRARVEL